MRSTNIKTLRNTFALNLSEVFLTLSDFEKIKNVPERSIIIILISIRSVRSLRSERIGTVRERILKLDLNENRRCELLMRECIVEENTQTVTSSNYPIYIYTLITMSPSPGLCIYCVAFEEQAC